jgi:hypothetical protein
MEGTDLMKLLPTLAARSKKAIKMNRLTNVLVNPMAVMLEQLSRRE